MPTTSSEEITSYTPEKMTLNPDEDTVEGRINRIIAANSPLMTLARTNAAQTANARGLRNSAMAASAGERAVIETALPIAQQDAQHYFTARQTNNQSANRALEFGAAGAQQLGLQRDRAAAESRLMQEKADIDERLLKADAAERGSLMERQARIDEQLRAADHGRNLEQVRLQSELDVAGRAYLADIEGRYASLRTASSNASGVMAASSQAIADVLASDIPVEQKQQFIDKIRTNTRDSLNLISVVHDIDLTDILGPIPPPEAPPATTPTPTYPPYPNYPYYPYYDPAGPVYNPGTLPYNPTYGRPVG